MNTDRTDIHGADFNDQCKSVPSVFIRGLFPACGKESNIVKLDPATYRMARRRWETMYCSSCGSAVKAGLSYCNRCGAALSGKERGTNGSSDISPDSLVWAIVAVSVGGLAILIGLLAVMREANLGFGTTVGFTALSFLLLLGAEIVFTWLLLRSRRRVMTADSTQQKRLDTNELGLDEERAFPEPAASVTDHTTRTLEQARRERIKK
jgi:hypothetical protein